MSIQPKVGETWLTRNGCKARILDDKFSHSDTSLYSLVVALTNGMGNEVIHLYTADGRFSSRSESHSDLVKKYEPPLFVVVSRLSGHTLTHALSLERAQDAWLTLANGSEARNPDDMVVVELKDFQLEKGQ